MDGRPNENRQYEKTVTCNTDKFLSYELDAFFLVTIVPGRSAFNRLKQEVIPLKKELSGALLEYDHIRSHLDNKGNIIDAELELKNVEHTSQVLAEIWNGMVIDLTGIQLLWNFP